MSEHGKPRRWIVQVVVAGIALLVASAVAAAVIPRVRQRRQLVDEAARAAAEPVRVAVTRPSLPASSRDLVLPGTALALRSTVIFARTSGYLKQRLVDIGDRVTEGQLLAVIETPELDQQLDQAHANRLQAKAALEQSHTKRELARVSLERIQTLAPAGVASRQDLDDRKATYDAVSADVRAAEASIAENDANVRRLMEMKGFARVTAPFGGTITERMTEIGSLITAGNGAGQALFKLDQSNPLRVMVAVPQSLSPSIHAGLAASVTVRQLPGRSFTGQVTRDAHALDAGSRTLLTEVQVPNGDGALLPGMYAEVTLRLEHPRPWLLLDAGALLQTADGPQVAVLGTDGRIHLRRVVIDVDRGAQLAISQGLRADERVVLNPDSSLQEGTPATAAN